MSDLAVIILTAPPTPHTRPGAMIKIDGRESVLRCMEMFTNREGVVQTMVVIDRAQAEEIKRKIGSHLVFMGIKLVTSGSSWWEQLADAQKALKDEAKHVLVHDGACPAVSYIDLDNLIGNAGKHHAITLACPIDSPLLKASSVPGTGWYADVKVAKQMYPALFSRVGFDEIVCEKKLPSPIEMLEGSELNVRCGSHDPAYVKAMLGLLPKPKTRAASSPFEEAQW
jgi:hypothetical protein